MKTGLISAERGGLLPASLIALRQPSEPCSLVFGLGIQASFDRS